jgi:hypothetical protein
VTPPLLEPSKVLQEPPPLVIQAPLCPMCGDEAAADGDGGWDCTACKAHWSGLDVGFDRGEWADDVTDACQSMARMRECVLPDGVISDGDDCWAWQCALPVHEGSHYSATGAEWPNPWLITTEDEK